VKSVVNLLVCSAAAAALLAGLAALQPSSLAAVALDLGALPGAERQTDRDRLKLEDDLEVVGRRTGAMDRMTRELVDGRLSLWEAVARFRALDEEQPSLIGHITAIYPDASRDGSVCRQVLAWAEEEVRGGSPGREEEVMARLQEEARSLLSPE
jgi:hypothetical protein